MRRPVSSTRAPCARSSCVSASTTMCGCTAYSEANIWRVCKCSGTPCGYQENTCMTITVQEITDREQWNGFLTSRPRGHLLQSYEWGELSQYLGARIYRLGALENGCMVGAMQLIVSSVPMPVPGLHFDWLYCARGPTVERPDSPALPALVEHAHAIARKEHAVVLRLEPNIADDDPAKACHPERSEGSGSPDEEILRCAQDDSQDPSPVRSREALSPNVYGEERSWFRAASCAL